MQTVMLFRATPRPCPLAADLTSTQKASRILKDCKFSARIAGAIHVVEIKGCLTYENL